MNGKRLYTRRLLGCALKLAACVVCDHHAVTSLYDADLLGRVCNECAEDTGMAQIELVTAGCVSPNPKLVRANP